MKLKIFLLSTIISLVFVGCGRYTGLKGTEMGSKNSGYNFIYDETVIEIDAEANPILRELGEAESCFEAVSCVFEGMDRMYTYRSFEIDTYSRDNIEYISAVIFKDDTIATSEGIGIGDSVERVVEIYGTGNDVGGMIVYEKGNVKLCFIIKNSMVASVEYRTTIMNK